MYPTSSSSEEEDVTPPSVKGKLKPMMVCRAKPYFGFRGLLVLFF